MEPATLHHAPTQSLTRSNKMTNDLRPHPAAALSSLYVTVDELCASQDAALMQILSIAKLARAALDGDVEDATDHAGHAFDAIMRIAAAANAELDAIQIGVEDSRLGVTTAVD
jgi:hypothetical protein